MNNKWLIDINFINDTRFSLWSDLFEFILNNKETTIYDPLSLSNNPSYKNTSTLDNINDYDVLVINTASKDNHILNLLHKRTGKLITPIIYENHTTTFNKLRIAEELNVDLILSEILPNELPLPISLKTESFFINKYLYTPPTCNQLSKNTSRNHSNLFIHDSRETTDDFVRLILPSLKTIKDVHILDISQTNLTKDILVSLKNYKHCICALNNPQAYSTLQLACKLSGITFKTTQSKSRSFFRYRLIDKIDSEESIQLSNYKRKNIREQVSALLHSSAEEFDAYKTTTPLETLSQIEDRLFNVKTENVSTFNGIFKTDNTENIFKNCLIQIPIKYQFNLEHPCTTQTIINYIETKPNQTEIIFLCELLITGCISYEFNPQFLDILKFIINNNINIEQSIYNVFSLLSQNDPNILKIRKVLLGDLLIATYLKNPDLNQKEKTETLLLQLYNNEDSGDSSRIELTEISKLKIYLFKNLNSNIIEEYNTFYKNNPNIIGAFSEVGNIYKFSGDLQTAKQLYHNDYNLNKRNYGLYLQFLIEQENFEEAESLANAFHQTQTQKFPSKTKLSTAIYRKYFDDLFGENHENAKKQMCKVVSLLKEEISSNCHNSATYELLAFANTCLLNLDAAQMCCEKSLENKNSTLYTRCALILYLLQQDSFKNFAQKQPLLETSADHLLFFTALNFLLSNKIEKAKLTFSQLHTLSPEFFTKYAYNPPVLLWRGMLQKFLNINESINELYNALEENASWPNLINRIKIEPNQFTKEAEDLLGDFASQLTLTNYEKEPSLQLS